MTDTPRPASPTPATRLTSIETTHCPACTARAGEACAATCETNRAR